MAPLPVFAQDMDTKKPDRRDIGIDGAWGKMSHIFQVQDVFLNIACADCFNFFTLSLDEFDEG